jgi:3-methyladenine DNA glycosylase Mpg
VQVHRARGFHPVLTFSTTSDGTPRIVEVTGATVTVDKYAIALSRVSTRTGRFLSGEANW